MTLHGLVITCLFLLIVIGLGYFLIVRKFASWPHVGLNERKAEKDRVKDDTHHGSFRRSLCALISQIFPENKAHLAELEHRVQRRTQQLEKKNQELEQTLTALKKAKNQIIVQEKLASLGSLVAGIAHEIKNPLNFIINFTDLSLDYLQELKEKAPNEEELFSLIEQNMTKSREHAIRADAIVKTMLAHARGGKGDITTFELNQILSQSIDLAFFGFQGQESHFNAKIIKDFDINVGEMQGFEQELSRVFLNISNNAFFSMNEKLIKLGQEYHPEFIVKTEDEGEMVKIIFQDNGKGMSPTVLNKIFNPFFTTKGAGKGTGLGLSLSHDIITHQHHGHLSAESKSGEYSRFIIELPKMMVTAE